MDRKGAGLQSLIETYCRPTDHPQQSTVKFEENNNNNNNIASKILAIDQAPTDDDEIIDIETVEELSSTCLLTTNPNVFESYDRTILDDCNNSGENNSDIEDNESTKDEEEQKPIFDSCTGEISLVMPQFTVSQLKEVNIKIEKASKLIKELLSNYKNTGSNLTDKEKDDILNLFSEFSPSVLQVFRLVSAFKYLYYKYDLSLKMILSFEKKLLHDLIFTKTSDDKLEDDIAELPSLVVNTKPLPFLNIFEHYDKSKMYENPIVVLSLKSLGEYFYLLINLRRLKVSTDYQEVAPQFLDCLESYYVVILKILAPFYNDLNTYSPLILKMMYKSFEQYLHLPFKFSDKLEEDILAAKEDVKIIQASPLSNSEWLELKSSYPPLFFQKEISNINRIFMTLPKPSPPPPILTPVVVDKQSTKPVPTKPKTSNVTLDSATNKNKNTNEKTDNISTPRNLQLHGVHSLNSSNWISNLLEDQERLKKTYGAGNQNRSFQKQQTPTANMNKNKQSTSTSKNHSVSSTLKTTPPSKNSSKTLSTYTSNNNKSRDKTNEHNRTTSSTAITNTDTREKNSNKNKNINTSANSSSRSVSSNKNDTTEKSKSNKEKPKSIGQSHQLTHKNTNTSSSSSSISQPRVQLHTVHNSARPGQGSSNSERQTTIRDRLQNIASKPPATNSTTPSNSNTASSSATRPIPQRSVVATQSSLAGQSFSQVHAPNLHVTTTRNNFPYNPNQQQQQQQFGASNMHPYNSVRQPNPPMSLSRRLHLDACEILGDPEPEPSMNFTMGRGSFISGVNQSNLYPNIPGMPRMMFNNNSNLSAIQSTAFDASNPWGCDQRQIHQPRHASIPVRMNSVRHNISTQIQPTGYGNYYDFQ